MDFGKGGSLCFHEEREHYVLLAALSSLRLSERLVASFKALRLLHSGQTRSAIVVMLASATTYGFTIQQSVILRALAL